MQNRMSTTQYGLCTAALLLSAACRVPPTVIDEEVPDTEIVYVSTNTGPIHVYTLDTASGQLSETSQVDGGVNPTYLAFSPNKRFAFAINEANPPDSKLWSFAIDQTNGALSPIDSVDTGAIGSPHIAVHPSGRWVVVAHYGRESDEWTGGQTNSIPVARDGTLGEPSASLTGPADNPCVNAHQVNFVGRGDHVLVPCLGSDSIVQYNFDRGVLGLNDPPEVKVAAESGPRHLALSPDQRHAYLLTEFGGTIVYYNLDAARGLLEEVGTVQSTSQPVAEGGIGWSAHILVHPSGKFLYVSNRLENTERGTENSLGVFTLDEDGVPSVVEDGFVFEDVNTARDFHIDPSGHFLISVNQEGDYSVLVFRIDQETGKLTRTQRLPLEDQPAFVHLLGAL
jgi:6-phosphogluconolactonase